MSGQQKLMVLRMQLYTAMQQLKDVQLAEFWALIDEIDATRGVFRIPSVSSVPLAGTVSDDRKTLYFWPYCQKCKQPYSFDDEEPFAYCGCGTGEWGYPRPAEWIPDPGGLADHIALERLQATEQVREGAARILEKYEAELDVLRAGRDLDEQTRAYAAAYREMLARGEIPEGRPGMPRDSMG